MLIFIASQRSDLGIANTGLGCSNKNTVSTLAPIQSLVQEKRWKEALEQIRPQLGEDAAWHYNAGTLALLDGNPGLAKAYLEKAAHLAPTNGPIHHQLQLAREQLGRMRGVSSIDAPLSMPLQIGQTLRSWPQFEAIAFILLLLLAILGIAFYRRVRAFRRWIRNPWVHLGLVLAIPTALALQLTLHAKATPWAVFTQEGVLRSGPGERFLDMGHPDPGMRMPRTGVQDAEWIQVLFKPGQRAWVNSSSVLLLD